MHCKRCSHSVNDLLIESPFDLFDSCWPGFFCSIVKKIVLTKESKQRRGFNITIIYPKLCHKRRGKRT